MRNIRKTIFVLFFVMLMIGVIMIYSSSAIFAYERFGNSAFFLKRHLLFIFIGFMMMLSVMLPELKNIRSMSKVLIGISIVFLIAVMIPGVGVSVGGARRWFRIGSLGFQPSELAKLSLILYLADFVSRKGYKIKDLFTGYIPPVLIIGVLCILVLLQPDLGTAVSLFAIGFLIMFIAGANIKHIVSTILLGLPFLYYLIFSVPYRRRRMLIFMDPWKDSKGAGFQIIQSFLALGCGGLFGVGLGQSKQKLFYLPESHTDFIFSIIGEELGFVGAASIVLLFSVFTILGMIAFLREVRTFNKIIIFGVTTMIAFEAIVNIGVSVGALPTKGLPLPFISYGGSSLVFHMAAVGLMLNAMRDES